MHWQKSARLVIHERTCTESYSSPSPEASKPINQMEVGKYLKDKLVAPVKGANQRAAAFAQALRDAPGALKRSTGFRRHEKLGDVLSRKQVGKVRGVQDDLERAADFKEMAGEGRALAQEIFSKQFPTLPATGPLNQRYMVIKTLLNRVAGNVNNRSMKLLGEVIARPAKSCRDFGWVRLTLSGPGFGSPSNSPPNHRTSASV